MGLSEKWKYYGKFDHEFFVLFSAWRFGFLWGFEVCDFVVRNVWWECGAGVGNGCAPDDIIEHIFCLSRGEKRKEF